MNKALIKARIVALIPKGIKNTIENFIKGKAIEETDIIFQIFKEDKEKVKRIMIDVGAHFGNTLLPFAKKEWKIFAFEPDEKNRIKLLANVEDFSNVEIDTRAVSDKSDHTVSFFTSDVSTGISSMASFHNSHQETAQIKTIRLADFCNEKNIKSIDFLKIDTEGFDLFVLKGFDWDKQVHPDFIVTEFEDRKTVPLGYTFQEQVSFLVERGYKVIVSEWHPIVEYGVRHKWRRFLLDPTKVTDKLAWGNIIASKPEKFDTLVANAKKMGHFE